MPHDVTQILNDPAYQRLVATRKRLSVLLSGVMLVAYVAFILAIAFKPAALGTPIAVGSPITVGLPIGIGLILLAFGLTGVYVRLSNTLFDKLTDDVRRNLKSK